MAIRRSMIEIAFQARFAVHNLDDGLSGLLGLWASRCEDSVLGGDDHLEFHPASTNIPFLREADPSVHLLLRPR